MINLDLDKAFKILEIDKITDSKKIKMAYIKLLKKYHPEEYPEKFMEINEAYERALNYAENPSEERNRKDPYEEMYGKRVEIKDNDLFEYIMNSFNSSGKFGDNNLKNLFDISNYIDNPKVRSYVFKFREKVPKVYENHKTTLNQWKELLQELHEKFDNEEKLLILKELERIYGKNLKNANLHEIEKKLFIYNLNSEHEGTGILVSDYEKKEKKGSLENFILKYYRIKELKLFEVFLGLFVIDKKHLKDKLFYEGHKLNITEKIKKVIYTIINIFKTFLWQSLNKEFIKAKRMILNLGLESKGSKHRYEKNIRKIDFLPILFYGTVISGLFFFRFLNIWWIFWMFVTVFIGFKEIELNKKSVYYWTDITLIRRATVISTVIFIMKMFLFNDTDYYFEIDVLLLIEYILLIIVLIIEEILLVKGRYDKIKEVTKKILDVFIHIDFV